MAGDLPDWRPMLAVAGPVPAGPQWAYEFKWDGVRALVHLDHGTVRVLSRNGRDVTASYPELAPIAEAHPRRRVILDGEVVALGPDGAPNFGLLQQRMHVRSPTPALRARVPVRLYAFDLLHADGDDLLNEPYLRRRDLLEALALPEPAAQVPPYWTGTDGRALLDAAMELGLEGVLAKQLNAPYQPGRRSACWIKTPCKANTEVVVCGWRPGSGRRAGTIGALLLGMYDANGALCYVGDVGTGFTDAALRHLLSVFTPLRRDRSPFDEQIPRDRAREARWLEPRTVGEVEFRTWTPERRLRHTSWRGLRPDREPAGIRLP